MSKFLLRLKKNQKKGISPVISTIILIVVALVIALLVGVFAFGLFSTNANSVTLQSANLYSGSASFVMSLKNPSSATIALSSATQVLNGQGVTALTVCAPTALTSGGTTSVTCTATGAIVGDNYNYVISLTNGQSISGTVVAQ